MAGLPDVYMKFENAQGEDDAFIGDCLDEAHPGEEGWITITNFSFGVGWGGGGSAPTARGGATAPSAQPSQPATTSSTRTPTAGGSPSQADTSGTLKADDVTFSKNSDSASISLIRACYKGKEIPQVIVEACRASGVNREEKVVFLRFTFKKVHLSQADTNVAEAALPSESYRFKFAEVELQYYWTDNSTGERLTNQPCTTMWNFEKKDGSMSRASE